MSFPFRFTLSLVLFIVLIGVGFMYLLRGCLSKYDERSIHPKVLYFEHNDKKVVFAIVKFDKTTSYTQRGGFISKTVSSSYSVQSNDAINGDKLDEKKIKDYDDIKNHPVDIMGAAGNYAWVFMGEPMVFDPFTLQIVASLKDFEKRNPSLKGKFPAEHRYYRFDNADHNLYFTATDGREWMIDGKTFEVSPQENTEKGVAARIKQLEKLLKENSTSQDSLMESLLRTPSRRLAAKEIDLKTYRQLTEVFYKQRTVLGEKRDSLQKLKDDVEAGKRSEEDLARRVESLQRNFSFGQAKLNADTIDGRWVGIYSEQEMDDLYERFSYQAAYNETARRQWYSSTFVPDKWGGLIIDKQKAAASTCLERFLNGGFLVNNQSGKPIRMNDGSYLIIYKNQVGDDARIRVARVSDKGVVKWTADTGLSEWADYIFNGSQLIITAEQNEELSGSECNILLLLNLSNGKSEKYDYFKQEKIKQP